MKIKTYIVIMCASLLVAGCSLDFDETNGDTKETGLIPTMIIWKNW